MRVMSWAALAMQDIKISSIWQLIVKGLISIAFREVQGIYRDTFANSSFFLWYRFRTFRSWPSVAHR
jgi:hypothetical protein